jgi:RNase P subunit RPR2
MPTLSTGHRQRAIEILAALRAQIDEAASSDEAIRFQLRRYIAKRLEFDERGTPTQRRKLKAQKLKYQRGFCAMCGNPLPVRGAELHRLKAINGYNPANTVLLCRSCHERAQASDVTGISLEEG